MQTESLVKLVGAGNIGTVEEEWMRMIESAEVQLSELAAQHTVLAELARTGRTSQAEELAWAAIEAVSTKHSAHDALRVAGPFLQAIGESAELRGEVAKLYRAAHAGFEGLEGLLLESGLAGGRPVRRALRTLEVALVVREGDFLTGRDEDVAARVEQIDRAAWMFEITMRDGGESLGAVHLADRFAPAPPKSFRVLRHFAPNELNERLLRDPASIVVDLCREHGNRIDGHKIESLIVPGLLDPAEWKGWFSKARTGLKRFPNINVESRTPFAITYVEQPARAEDTLWDDFEKQHGPIEKLAVTEKYVRECRMRKQTVAADVLRKCFEYVSAEAASMPPGLDKVVSLLVARRLGELGGAPSGDDAVVHWLSADVDIAALLPQLDSDSLLNAALDALAQARPDSWRAVLLTLLPTLPMWMCEQVADKLKKSGCDRADFEPVVRAVLAVPARNYGALFWLWDESTEAKRVTDVSALTILTRVLRILEEARRGDHDAGGLGKEITHKARTVLAARKFQAFEKCLETIDANMASMLRSQLRRLDNLGRAVRDDMVDMIKARFGTLEAPPPVLEPWMREDIIYVTEHGMARKRSELDQLVNVKMKENARAIGTAAEHGDLSENSEYKFALEERDLLRARLAQMNSELGAAVVLAPEEVPTDHVGIGSHVVLKKVTDGATYEMSFVGPWDADGAANRFNYRAPFCKDIMGKRLGDIVEFNHSGAIGSFEIVELRNALTEDL